MNAFEREELLESELRNIRDAMISGAEVGMMTKDQRAYVADRLQSILVDMQGWKLKAVAEQL